MEPSDNKHFRESDSRDFSPGTYVYAKLEPEHSFGDDFDPSYAEEYEEEPAYRWSDDPRSEASHENHSGKGPVGYQRSNKRIQAEASEVLAQSWRLDAREIEVEVDDGCIFLKGSVYGRQEKKLAEQLVEGLSGVRDVMNELKISGGRYGEG